MTLLNTYSVMNVRLFTSAKKWKEVLEVRNDIRNVSY